MYVYYEEYYAKWQCRTNKRFNDFKLKALTPCNQYILS